MTRLFDVSFSIAFRTLGIRFANAVIDAFVLVNSPPFSVAFTGAYHDFRPLAQGACLFVGCHFMFPFRK